MYMNTQVIDFDDYSIIYFTDDPLFTIKKHNRSWYIS